MNSQIGNFSSLFEVGVALNLSFSLFAHVRDIGKLSTEKLIRQKFSEWKDEAELFNRGKKEINTKILDDAAKIATDNLNQASNLASEKSTWWIFFTIIGALFCFFMLGYCAVFGQSSCSLPGNTKWLIGLAVVGNAIMPISMLRMHLFWKKKRVEIMAKVDNNRELWDEGNKRARSAAIELNNSVNGKG